MLVEVVEVELRGDSEGGVQGGGGGRVVVGEVALTPFEKLVPLGYE